MPVKKELKSVKYQASFDSLDDAWTFKPIRGAPGYPFKVSATAYGKLEEGKIIWWYRAMGRNEGVVASFTDVRAFLKEMTA